MKKLKLFSALLALVVFTACDKEDAIINNTYDGSQVGVGFTTSGTSVSVKPEGAVVTLGVQSTVSTSADRSYDVMVNTSLSTGSAGHYTLGSVVIPAGSYDGVLTVNMIDDGTLVEGISYDLVVELDLPAGVAVHTSKSAKISYNKYQLCNDYVLTLNEDYYSSERTWEVVDADGTTVVSGGPYPDNTYGPYVESFTLADGCYTFTIYDSYGDGQYDGSTNGSYSLDCGISNAASGTGNWGASDTTEFCVNP